MSRDLTEIEDSTLRAIWRGEVVGCLYPHRSFWVENLTDVTDVAEDLARLGLIRIGQPQRKWYQLWHVTMQGFAYVNGWYDK